MATIGTRVERGMTVFDVTWADPDAVSALVCDRDEAFWGPVAAAISRRARSKRARTRPWSLVLELSRKHVSVAGDLDDYFAGLADLLYRTLSDVYPDVPESIEIAWPASAYEGVYKTMGYSPIFE
jgi:hypothetical protein